MKVYSPWTDEEIKNLKKRQANKTLHPYTCADCGEVLVPTEFGFVCPSQYCDYMQNWAFDSDTERRNNGKDINSR